MEKYIIKTIALSLIGCRAVKDFFFDEDDDELKLGKNVRLPLPCEVVQNPDGSWTVNLNQSS